MDRSDYIYGKIYYYEHYKCYIQATSYYPKEYYNFKALTKPNRYYNTTNYVIWDYLPLGEFSYNLTDLRAITTIRSITKEELVLVKELYA